MALSPHVPDLAALETVEAVARTGSMGAAAAELRVSQQAVSQRVRTAERLLGVELFRRGPSGARPTETGALVLDAARAVLEAAGELDRLTGRLRGGARTTVRVAVSNTVAEALVPDWAARLRAAAPEVAVSAGPGNSEDVLDRVTRGDVALGFVECPEVPAHLASRRVATDELVVVAPPGHRWATLSAAGGEVSVAELAATPLVTREPGSGTRATAERELRAAGHEIAPPYLELGSTPAVRSAVLASGVPAVLSSLAVAHDLEVGRLVRVAVAGADWRRTLRAVWDPRHPPTGATGELLRIALGSGPAQASR